MPIFSDISIYPPFPAAVIAGLGAAVLALTLVAYHRARGCANIYWRAFLAGFRCVTIAALVMILLRPMRAIPDALEAGPPIFAIAVDQSASMKTPDMEGVSRDAAVRNVLKRGRATFERTLAERYDVRYFTFASEAEPATLDDLLDGHAPSGMTTDLASALVQSTATPANRTLAGLLLISDGRDNAGSDARRAAAIVKGANAGIWTVAVGGESESRDVYVSARLKQRFLYVDQPGAIVVTVSQSGLANQYATASLMREGETIAHEQIALTGRGAVVEFPITENHKGVRKYSVAVAPLPGEADAKNNTRTVFVRTVEERTKVLFVETRPYWDSKFLLRALQRDPNIEVTSLFEIKEGKIVAIAEKSERDSTGKTSAAQGVSLPKTRDELFKFDCIILGKGVDALLSADQMALIRDFVRERGGGVVFSRARSYGFDNEALAALEPLVWERDSVHGKRFELTPEGRTNPAFSFGGDTPPDTVIRELPEMVSVTKVAQEKSLSVVLARSKIDTGAREMATIAYQRYGKGKVMSVGATGLWRWAITPPELGAFDDVYERFWGQMIRWMVSGSDFLPGQEISFRTDRFTYDFGDPVQFSVQTKYLNAGPFTPVAEIKAPSGKQITVPLVIDTESPGAYSASFLPDEEGEFSATLRDEAPGSKLTIQESAPFTVYSDNTETRFVSVDTALMNDLARITGGEPIALDRLETLPEKVRAFERQTQPGVKPSDVWDSLEVFSALLVLLALEWAIRRRTGLA